MLVIHVPHGVAAVACRNHFIALKFKVEFYGFTDTFLVFYH
jgi:hypothetical protein